MIPGADASPPGVHKLFDQKGEEGQTRADAEHQEGAPQVDHLQRLVAGSRLAVDAAALRRRFGRIVPIGSQARLPAVADPVVIVELRSKIHQKEVSTENVVGLG